MPVSINYNIVLETNLKNNTSSRLIIIFSDFGELMQVNEKGIVEKIAKKYNFVLTNKKNCNSDFKITDSFDPLKNFKKSSKVSLYEFKRTV